MATEVYRCWPYKSVSDWIYSAPNSAKRFNIRSLSLLMFKSSTDVFFKCYESVKIAYLHLWCPSISRMFENFDCHIYQYIWATTVCKQLLIYTLHATCIVFSSSADAVHFLDLPIWSVYSFLCKITGPTINYVALFI